MKLNSLKSIILALLLTLSVSTVFASGFSETTVQWLSEKGFSPVLIILIISMLPLIELRGSIPVAILLFKMSWQEALILSLIGNMLPIPLILLFMDWFFESISRFPLGKRFTNWLFTRTRRKGKAIERYEAIGLAIFVGIPLPGTGAWTGAFAAKIFDIKFWKSILYIFLGVVSASAIVTILSLMGKFAVSA